jgi:hypothetical protein
MESFRGPETQVLRVKPSARLSRSWNPGPESETRCSSVEVLKPKSWEWNPVSVYRGPETQVRRAKCSNAGLQARADCVRPSRVPTSCHKLKPAPMVLSMWCRENVSQINIWWSWEFFIVLFSSQPHPWN